MWQMSVGFGAIAGLGVLLVVRELVPSVPRLKNAVERLDGAGAAASPPELASQSAGALTVRVGWWAQRHLPTGGIAAISPTKRDRDLVDKALHVLLGEKVLSAGAGVAFGPVVALGAALVGVNLPLVIPAGASVLLGVGLWLLPDLETKAQAERAREEFARATGAYLELIAIERISGAGAVQAMEGAAEVGRSWPFRRITAALERARWSGKQPWTALAELAEETGVPELEDVADIMRMSGAEGASVYESLRARSRSVRGALMSKEEAQANTDSERMTFPMVGLAMIFMVGLIYPALAQIL